MRSWPPQSRRSWRSAVSSAFEVPSSREPLVCLDTTFLVDLVRARPEAEKKLLHFLENDERITTTPLNAAELYDGAFSRKCPDWSANHGSQALTQTRACD